MIIYDISTLKLHYEEENLSLESLIELADIYTLDLIFVRDNIVAPRSRRKFTKLITVSTPRDRIRAEQNFIQLLNGDIEYILDPKTKKWLLIDSVTKSTVLLHKPRIKKSINEKSHYALTHLTYPQLIDPFIKYYLLNAGHHMRPTRKSLSIKYGLTDRESRTFLEKY